MANKTYFNNQFDEYSPEVAIQLLTGSLDGISKDFHAKLRTFNRISLHSLTSEMEEDIFCDGTVYTGSAGLAFYYLSCAVGKDETSKNHLKTALKYINMSKLKGRRISFLCGDAGPLALATVISFKLENEKPDNLPGHQVIAQRLMSLSSLLNDSPDELLYGRVGYLYALLFVNKHTGGNTIPANQIEKVISLILRSGKQLSTQLKSESPMIWQWHDKVYYGGAHGMAGILYLLLQAIQYINIMELRNFIKPTLDWLLGQQFPSGNMPSSRGSSSGDRLVQWCHGAPGFVPLCILAHEIFQEEKYLEIALKCGEVVWERGLCSKGYSICHGVAGNAYAFIQLYQATQDPKQLYRACCFADWVVTEKSGSELHPPDRPASLFEGLVGRVHFIEDMLRINDAKFPAYTI